MLDVGKRYRRQHDRTSPLSFFCNSAQLEPSAEDQVLHVAFFADLAAASAENGVSGQVLDTILRSRVRGASMAELAAEQTVTVKVLWHRRWRAEARPRDFPLT